MKIRRLIAGVAVLAVTGVLTSPLAMAQWARPGGYGYGGYQQGGYPPAGGYPPPGYPPPGGYAPSGYRPPGGYPPPAGYAAPGGYPPPGGYLPQGAYAPPPAGAPQAPGVPPVPGGAPPPPTPYAYPQKGQSPEQVSTDQSQCATWATQQSGYNPSAPATTASTTFNAPPKDLGLFGGISRREDRREERWEHRDQRWGGGDSGQQTPSSPPSPQKTDAYNRALDACLSARGYTVR